MITKEEFELLPDNEKRVVIAKDVLEQLVASKIKAMTGFYLSSTLLRQGYKLEAKNKKESLQKILQEDTNCYVCALGALFVSDVLLRNEFEVDYNLEFFDSSPMRKKLDYFSEEQLFLIESAFEKEYLTDSNQLTFQAVDFGEQYESPKFRLVAIMNNIIENNGEFKP